MRLFHTDFAQGKQSINEVTEDNVFAIQEFALVASDKELASVGVWSRVCLIEKQAKNVFTTESTCMLLRGLLFTIESRPA